MTPTDMLTLFEAAVSLGVSERRAQQIAENGQITRVARGLFDRASVERHRAERGTGLTRSWAEHTAWGAIAILSKAAPLGLGDTQNYRLRATLREITDPPSWPSGCVTVRQSRPGPATDRSSTASGKTSSSPVASGSGSSRTTPSLTATSTPTCPGPRTPLPVEPRQHRHDHHARHRHGHRLLQGLAAFNRTLAGVDAATSLDPRERGVGEQVMVGRLELFRENSRR